MLFYLRIYILQFINNNFIRQCQLSTLILITVGSRHYKNGISIILLRTRIQNPNVLFYALFCLFAGYFKTNRMFLSKILIVILSVITSLHGLAVADLVTNDVKNDDELKNEESQKMDSIRKSEEDVTEENFRHNKALSYYDFYPRAFPSTPVTPYHAPVYPPIFPVPYSTPYPSYYPVPPLDEYDEDDEYLGDNNLDDDRTIEDTMSRVNSKRRPSNNKNSPIFYIRLPPTPYVFVPGMGYVPQVPQYAIPPPMMPPAPTFANLPVNFVSNGKPTNIYQWNSPPNYYPEYPSYVPPRRQRPYHRPKPYLHESKVTHLKGSYMFNGRPEDVYVLPHPHYDSAFNQPYSQDSYQPVPPPYNGYPSVYPSSSYY